MKGSRQTENGGQGRSSARSSWPPLAVEDLLALAAAMSGHKTAFGAAFFERLAQSAEEFAQSLEDVPQFQARIGTVAQALDDLSAYLRRTDVETVIGDARVFARQHPLSTFAAAIAAGVAVSQMMRTAPARRRSRASGETSRTRQTSKHIAKVGKDAHHAARTHG